jgi:hypothetical protein
VGNLEVELAGLRVPVEREVAVEVLHGAGFAGDGLCGRERRDCQESQSQVFGHALF